MEYCNGVLSQEQPKLGIIIINQIQTVDWWKWQQADECLKLTWGYIEQLMKPPLKGRNGLPKEAKVLLCDFQIIVLDEGVLCREQEKEGQEVYQLVLPLEHCRTALQGLHDDALHFGVEKTLSLVRDHFCWPKNGKGSGAVCEIV